MNEIVNKFSLAGDKLMTEMHLKQPGFTYVVLYQGIVLLDHLLKRKKESRSLKKLGI